jgi:Holliday junction resolvase RusA-like endonuclease
MAFKDQSPDAKKMVPVRFSVHGKPQTWKRAHDRAGGGRRNPSGMAAHQRTVQWSAKAARARPVEGPCILLVRAVFDPPKRGRDTPDTARYGDGDNLAKQIGDALNTLAYEDDGQAVMMVVTKEFARAGELARTEVQVLPVQSPSAWSGLAGRMHRMIAKLAGY